MGAKEIHLQEIFPSQGLNLGLPHCRQMLYRWKPPKCPSTDDWIKKMWYVFAMEYYSTLFPSQRLLRACLPLSVLFSEEAGQKSTVHPHTISYTLNVLFLF